MANADIALVCGLNFRSGARLSYVRIQMMMKLWRNGRTEVIEVLAHNHCIF